MGFAANFQSPNLNLSKYLNSPSVSSQPTPNVGSTMNLAQYFDTQVLQTHIANALGLTNPSVSKPSAGAATAVIAQKSTKHHGAVLLLALVAIGVVVAARA
jgi:hypothetical protein